jgi:hypothetical protein
VLDLPNSAAEVGAPPLTWLLQSTDRVWGVVTHLEGPAGGLERSAVFGQAWLATL